MSAGSSSRKCRNISTGSLGNRLISNYKKGAVSFYVSELLWVGYDAMNRIAMTYTSWIDYWIR